MKKVFSCLIAMMVFIAATVPALAFEAQVADPDELPVLLPESSSWAQTELTSAAGNGLLTMSLGTDYKLKITRYQFCDAVVNLTEKVLGRELDSASPSTFADTQEKSVLKAYQAGIVSGISDTEFAPDANITREQIAAMLFRAISYLEKETGKTLVEKNSALDSFADRNSVSSYAKESVGVLANGGIMMGTSATTLEPKGTATIEQCVLLIQRIYNLTK